MIKKTLKWIYHDLPSSTMTYPDLPSHLRTSCPLFNDSKANFKSNHLNSNNLKTSQNISETGQSGPAANATASVNAPTWAGAGSSLCFMERKKERNDEVR
jgi:hypothetical protein